MADFATLHCFERIPRFRYLFFHSLFMHYNVHDCQCTAHIKTKNRKHRKYLRVFALHKHEAFRVFFSFLLYFLFFFLAPQRNCVTSPSTTKIGMEFRPIFVKIGNVECFDDKLRWNQHQNIRFVLIFTLELLTTHYFTCFCCSRGTALTRMPIDVWRAHNAIQVMFILTYSYLLSPHSPHWRNDMRICRIPLFVVGKIVVFLNCRQNFSGYSILWM